ncbi:hypothetical protein IYR97_23770 (plasmid) [Pseudomonas fulva]|uniref:Uncharacterized protein n=2 Tax=Pseudomonas putida group TaxID=136845 RepID=A0ABD7BLB1_PSEPU|nr:MULTISPECIES: hypothetical protein [Pseudomonas putida group]QOD01541.1 hypothetical protein ID616_30430 [Pseudomonas putida]QPH46815.1 hypothetical protein IYR97_23770 [Pseudomonas fulva]QPH51988.1 hypothetical protein IZU98_24220 [Pseudomonas fulva]
MTNEASISNYYRYRSMVQAVRLDEDGKSGPEEVEQQVLSVTVPAAGQRVSGAFFGDLPGTYLVVQVRDFEVLPQSDH